MSEVQPILDKCSSDYEKKAPKKYKYMPACTHLLISVSNTHDSMWLTSKTTKIHINKNS